MLVSGRVIQQPIRKHQKNDEAKKKTAFVSNRLRLILNESNLKVNGGLNSAKFSPRGSMAKDSWLSNLDFFQGKYYTP